MQLQLWKSDEYGQGSIEETSTSIEALIKKAKDEVTATNVNNSLAVSEKENAWEAMYIELYDTDTGEIVENAVYGGKTTSGKHCVIITEGDDAGTTHRLEDCDVEVRVFLGKLDREDWHLKDPRGQKHITDLTKIDMVGRSIYYIRPVRQPRV